MIASPQSHPSPSIEGKYRPTARDFVLELGLVLLVTLAYFLTRGLVRGRQSDAFHHARDILLFEQRLHLAGEQALQKLVLPHPWIVDLANAVYLVGHLPVLATVAWWLYWHHHTTYRRFRLTFLISAALGLSLYLVFPVAPPRFLPGFIDTQRLTGFNVDGSAVGAFYNPYAALPSLHVGWSILAGLAIVRHGRSALLRSCGILLPLAMTLSVVATGNHFLLDAFAGMLVVAFSILLTELGLSLTSSPPRSGSLRRMPRVLQGALGAACEANTRLSTSLTQQRPDIPAPIVRHARFDTEAEHSQATG